MMRSLIPAIPLQGISGYFCRKLSERRLVASPNISNAKTEFSLILLYPFTFGVSLLSLDPSIELCSIGVDFKSKASLLLEYTGDNFP